MEFHCGLLLSMVMWFVEALWLSGIIFVFVVVVIIIVIIMLCYV